MGNKALWAPEITFDTATGTGSALPFSAALSSNPAIIIFDNQSNVSVIIGNDTSGTGRTFVAGQALVIDLRTNRQIQADDFTFSKGDIFYATCAAGVGYFRISWVYSP